MGGSGLPEQLARLGPVGRVGLLEHRLNGQPSGEDRSRQLENGILVEESGEARTRLVVDVAHGALDQIADLELVDPLAAAGRRVAHRDAPGDAGSDGRGRAMAA